MCIVVHIAVTEAGKVGDPLAQNFFQGEYGLNHYIGTCVSETLHTLCLRYVLSFFMYAGTYKKPFVAIIDGITMGGVRKYVVMHYH